MCQHNWLKGTYLNEPAKICTICGRAEYRFVKRVIWYGQHKKNKFMLVG